MLWRGKHGRELLSRLRLIKNSGTKRRRFNHECTFIFEKARRAMPTKSYGLLLLLLLSSSSSSPPSPPSPPSSFFVQIVLVNYTSYINLSGTISIVSHRRHVCNWNRVSVAKGRRLNRLSNGTTCLPFALSFRTIR